MSTNKVFSKVQGFTTMIEKELGKVFAKVPHLNKKWVDKLAGIFHWLILAAAILSVLAAFGMISAISGVMKLGVGFGFWTVLAVLVIILLGVSAYFYGMAYKPLSENKKLGWDRVFYVQLIMLVVGFVCLLGGNIGQLISSLFGSAIGLYLLFEIKDKYK